MSDSVSVDCPECGESREVSKSNKVAAQSRFCRKCGGKRSYETRKKNGTLKPMPSVRGMTFSRGGYISSYGYKILNNSREHRIIIENALGRTLNTTERVHHINMNKLDNRLENLYLCTDTSEHHKVHAALNPLVEELINDGVIGFENGRYIYNGR